jgi:hypothetical protein
MKILNILVFCILITTNVNAGGVYGTLYDSSDLVDPKSRYVDNPHQELSDVKKEKEQRAKQEEEEQRSLNETINKKLKGLSR